MSIKWHLPFAFMVVSYLVLRFAHGLWIESEAHSNTPLNGFTILAEYARTGSALLYDRFSKETIRVIIAAHGESFDLGRYDVGCEQLFLGLLHEHKGLYVGILNSLGLTLEESRRVVREISGTVQGPTANEIIFTNDAERCLELAWGEAQRLGVDQIEPPHILMALLITDSKSLATLWAELRINRAKVKDHVFKMLS